jgi:radical SAM protein (TIGR01212 family)
MSETQAALPYRPYSQWLKARYGEKVYKLPLNIPVTCPNRDGTLARGGCIYCGEKGGGEENLPDTMPISQQIAETREKISRRYHARLFIPFFQSFSNTYLPLERLKEAVETAAAGEEMVGVAIATRPDCIFDEQLDYLADFARRTGKDVSVELGLQTANDKTLVLLNRGHSLGDYIRAAIAVKSRGLQLCTHVILDLPWDEAADVVTTAQVLSAVGSDFVKCHALYVPEGTRLHSMLQQGEITLLGEEAYLERCMLFLEHLSQELVLQRVIGRSPEKGCVTANWNQSWWKVRDLLIERMAAQGRFQGRLYNCGRQRVRRKIEAMGQ